MGVELSETRCNARSEMGRGRVVSEFSVLFAGGLRLTWAGRVGTELNRIVSERLFD